MTDVGEGKRIIVVLGMHRSGTSVLTRALWPFGVELGERLPPPAADNETGHWEDLDVQALNIDLLRVLERDWDTLAPISREAFESPRLAPLRLRAMQLLRDKLETCEIFGLKDPRMALLLPFWSEIFQRLRVRVSFVLALRNPISVAQSLRVRNDFESEKSYYLWLQHVAASVVGSGGHRRIVVGYDVLMNDPRNELARLGKALDLVLDETLAGEFAAEFLQARLRHSHFRAEDLAQYAAVPAEVVNAYRVLEKCASDVASLDDAEVEETFRVIDEELRKLAPALKYMSRRDDEVRELRGTSAERMAESEQAMRAQFDRFERELRSKREELAESRRRLEQGIADASAAEDELRRIRKREAQLELGLHSLVTSLGTSIVELRVQVGLLKREQLEGRMAYESLWGRFSDLFGAAGDVEALRRELGEAQDSRALLAARLSEAVELVATRVAQSPRSRLEKLIR